MKKVFVLALMSLVVFAVSCKKEDDRHPIEGTWYLESYTETYQGTTKTYTTDECNRKGSMTFSAGKVKYIECDYSENDNTKCECHEDDLQETYTIEGNKLIRKGVEKVSDKEYPYTSEKTFSIEGNTLTIFNERGDKDVYKKR